MTAGGTRRKAGADQFGHRWQGMLLVASLVIMASVAALWLGYQFYRLLWQPAELAGRPVHPGAIDLIERYNEIRTWLSGEPVPNAVYPPASYLMLWPMLGWLPLQGAINLWAATSLAALGWMAVLSVRESGARGRARLVAAVLPLSMYATGATIGNGQLNLHVLPMLIVGVLALHRQPASWPRDIGASMLVLASLVKPTFSAPFFWIVALAIGRLRPAVLIVLGYVVLALAASPFNPGGPVQQHADWLSYGSRAAFYSSALAVTPLDRPRWPSDLSINPLQYSLTLVGLQQWTSAASLVVLALLGLWVYRNRLAEVWLLLGVTAIAARFWTYHRWYDDLLILLPMITLWRMSSSQISPGMTSTRWLLGALVITSLAPGGLFFLPPPMDGVYVIVQLTVWLAVLAHLLMSGRRHS